MKRITAVLLALVMLFTLTATAFAQGVIPSADRTSVKKGEQVKVAMTMEEAVSGVTTAEFRVEYDDTLFAYDYDATKQQDKAAGISISKPDAEKDPAHCVRYTYSNNDEEGGSFSAGQKLATLVFTAKEDVTDERTVSFKSSVYTFAKADGTHPVGDFDEKTISVTITPVVTPAAGYTVAAEVEGNTGNVQLSEKAQVALVVGHTDESVTTYNAYYMVVTYDPAVLTYKSINADATVTDTNGTLKIAGIGADKSCTGNKIILSFTAAKTGTANVTVTAAKVDAKANVAEKDAPDAIIAAETATAVITVGGYTVNLPDALEGATTVNHGEDYTFSVKDTGKKYTISATMGGEDVTVVDNGDGTYTIKHVTGELVISAVANKVKVVLTGDAISGIANKSWGTADEVEAGKGIYFMLKTGGEYVVTVNGTEISGVPMQGVMLKYDIPADMVKGDTLTIDISYKTDKVKIKVTGDAVGDIINKSWGMATEVDAGTAVTVTVNDMFKEHVVTANGEVLTGVMGQRPGFNIYTVPAEMVVAGATITIDVSYKVVAPDFGVAVSKYVELDGKTMYLITANSELTDSQVLAYEGNQMYWSAKYSAYAWLVISDRTPDEVKADAAEKITVVGGAKTEITYSGDVNLTGNVDINDAQFVWNMYNAEYESFTGSVNVRKFLEADMNGDKALTVKDSAFITDSVTK